MPKTFYWREIVGDLTWVRSQVFDTTPEGFDLLTDDEIADLRLNDPAARMAEISKSEAAQKVDAHYRRIFGEG